MRTNKYGNFLTILLVILIIGILVGVGILIYNVVKSKNSDDRIIEAIAEFDKTVEKDNNEDNATVNEEVLDNLITPPDSSTSTNTTNKKVYYEGFVMLGYITIPKTGVKLPILDSVTPQSLDTAVAVLYPSNTQLNEPGNVVIIGHNYRNGKFFSDNDKLAIGDKILIKDSTGRSLTYTIYQKFQTTEQDTSFYTRDTNGVAEITLSTCTDDSKARIIILAKAE